MVTVWKEGKGQAARGIYTMTKETETYKQQLNKERHILAARTKADMDKLDPYFKVNNEYLGIMSKDSARDTKPIPIKFEVKFNNQLLFYKHPLEKLGNTENEYCQKCKRDRAFCIHKNRETIVDANNILKFPLTTLHFLQQNNVYRSQAYGWMEPLDNPNWGYGLQSSDDCQFTYSFRTVTKEKGMK